MGEISEEKPATSKRDIREVISFFRTIIVVVLLALFVRFFIVEPFKIPSGSMQPTLMIGDFILVSKLNYGIRIPFVPDRFLWMYDTPDRSDIVVFTRPDDPDTENVDESDVNLIKRVVAVSGDEVEVRKNQLSVNGKVVEEENVWWLEGGIRDFGPAKVPTGHVFLLGDNRDHSKDSRFWAPSSFLPVERVVGKAYFIYWSRTFDRIGTILK